MLHHSLYIPTVRPWKESLNTLFQNHPPELRGGCCVCSGTIVNLITTTAAPTALPVSDVREAINKDKLLCLRRDTIQWSNNRLKRFKLINDDLTINYDNGVLLRSTRIIVPTSHKNGHEFKLLTGKN